VLCHNCAIGLMEWLGPRAHDIIRHHHTSTLPCSCGRNKEDAFAPCMCPLCGTHPMPIQYGGKL
jgi:hypothetical protein